MLRVKIELVPFGDETKAKTIGEMLIANDGTGTAEKGNYAAVVAPDEWNGQPIMYANLKNYDRKLSVWCLVQSLLEVLSRYDLPGSQENVLYKRLKNRLSIK